jgi:hypothetical protein
MRIDLRQHRDMRIRALGAVLVLLLAAALAGCTPPVVAITAVYLDEGHPAVLVQPCGQIRVDQVQVAEEVPVTEQSSAGLVGPSWSTHDPTGQHPVVHVRLLEAPPGWSSTVDKDHPLTRFLEGRTYVVSVGTNQATVVVPLRFTLGDLRILKRGQVWAEPVDPVADEQPMTSEEFARQASAHC